MSNRHPVHIALCPFCAWSETSARAELAAAMLVQHRVNSHKDLKNGRDLYLDWAREHVEECLTEKELHEKQKQQQYAGDLMPAASGHAA